MHLPIELPSPETKIGITGIQLRTLEVENVPRSILRARARNSAGGVWPISSQNTWRVRHTTLLAATRHMSPLIFDIRSSK